MECQRFGSIPIVRRTGGLADTVSEAPITQHPSPNGIVFEGYSPDDLASAVERAALRYRDPEFMGWLVDNALLQRNGWETRVAEYEAVYGM
jgi:starch synthase